MVSGWTEVLGKQADVKKYQGKATGLRAAMLKHLWFPQEAMFFNMLARL